MGLGRKLSIEARIAQSFPWCSLSSLQPLILFLIGSVSLWLYTSTHRLDCIPILFTEEHLSNDDVFAACTCIHQGSSSIPEGFILSSRRAAQMITSFCRNPYNCDRTHFWVTDRVYTLQCSSTYYKWIISYYFKPMVFVSHFTLVWINYQCIEF